VLSGQATVITAGPGDVVTTPVSISLPAMEQYRAAGGGVALSVI